MFSKTGSLERLFTFCLYALWQREFLEQAQHDEVEAELNFRNLVRLIRSENS
jgi:hypothetical protein